ncbi:MFS multidrug transporter [Beauveria brongniartii RCEF 3172]|uniref:MFS multidrug transporter n=1 Tax=Beauveria brongniartii RCEF 3172 TaxID=1081107 RepID=A0A167EHA8_9HYPO|nr:MFS multidrug transporter [Beauveria brongniartii RCEF 3172]
MLGAEDQSRRAHPVDQEDDDGRQYAEESPLLLRIPSDEESSPGAYPRPGGGGASPTVFNVTVAASVIILISDVVASVPMTPRLVIFEDIICRNYYDAWGGGGSGDSRMGDCKVEPVQAELAVINGWKETFDTIPGVLVSIPYGALANHIGRTNVLMLALFGSLLSECWLAMVCWFPQKLPLRALWFSGAFQLIGGGGATLMAMCYTMIADMCTPQQSQRLILCQNALGLTEGFLVRLVQNRTAAFSYVQAAVLVSEIISIPLGSAFASTNPWIPILGSVGILAATLIVVLLFLGRYFPSSAPEYQSICGKDDRDDDDTCSNPAIDSAATSLQKPAVSTLANASFGHWVSRDVLLMLVAFFCCQLSRQFSSVLLQFSSFKFSWDYAKASYLLPLRAGINLVVLFWVIPHLLRFFTKQRGLIQWQADKYVTLLSGVCLAIGSILIFLSANPLELVFGQTFIALGFSFTVTARSFLTAMVEPRFMSLLYSGVTSVTYAGLIVGGPVFSTAFQWGLKLGGIWIGLPFLVAAVLFTVAFLTTLAATVTG